MTNPSNTAPHSNFADVTVQPEWEAAMDAMASCDYGVTVCLSADATTHKSYRCPAEGICHGNKATLDLFATLRSTIEGLEAALLAACENIGANNHLENVRNGSPVDSGVWFIENPKEIRDFYLTAAREAVEGER